jgi:hypothetical protein
MSLPARQERVLGRIEHSLHAGDPRLRSMFATFTKLTRGQQMPRLEQLESRSWPLRCWLKRLTRPRRRRRTARGALAAGTPGTTLRAIIIVPIMLLVLASAVLLGVGARSGSRCGQAIRVEHSAPALSQAKTCLLVPQKLVHQRLPSG